MSSSGVEPVFDLSSEPSISSIATSSGDLSVVASNEPTFQPSITLLIADSSSDWSRWSDVDFISGISIVSGMITLACFNDCVIWLLLTPAVDNTPNMLCKSDGFPASSHADIIFLYLAIMHLFLMSYVQ